MIESQPSGSPRRRVSGGHPPRRRRRMADSLSFFWRMPIVQGRIGTRALIAQFTHRARGGRRTRALWGRLYLSADAGGWRRGVLGRPGRDDRRAQALVGPWTPAQVYVPSRRRRYGRPHRPLYPDDVADRLHSVRTGPLWHGRACKRASWSSPPKSRHSNSSAQSSRRATRSFNGPTRLSRPSASQLESERTALAQRARSLQAQLDGTRAQLAQSREELQALQQNLEVIRFLGEQFFNVAANLFDAHFVVHKGEVLHTFLIDVTGGQGEDARRPAGHACQGERRLVERGVGDPEDRRCPPSRPGDRVGRGSDDHV